MNYKSTDYDAFALLTSAEHYHASIILSFLPDAADVTPTQGTISFTNTTYGQLWDFWPFKSDETTSTNYIALQEPNMLIFVGTLKGKGVIFRGTATSSPLKFGAVNTALFTANGITSGI